MSVPAVGSTKGECSSSEKLYNETMGSSDLPLDITYDSLAPSVQKYITSEDLETLRAEAERFAKREDHAEADIVSAGQLFPAGDGNDVLNEQLPEESLYKVVDFGGEKGRGLVATEDISSEGVVLRKKPDIAVLYSEHVRSRCFSCFCPVAGQTQFMCEYCFQFVLCQNCNCPALWDSHHLPCKWLLMLPAENQEKDTDYLRFILSYCARVQSGDRRLMYVMNNLRSHEEEQHEDLKEFYRQYSNLIAEKFASQGLIVSKEHMYEALLKTQRVNSLGFPLDPTETLGWSIQLHICMANHSCRPNCVIDQSPEGEMVLRTQRAVKKGEELTIAYTRLSSDSKIEERREKLLEEYKFHCACEFCKEELAAQKGTKKEN